MNNYLFYVISVGGDVNTLATIAENIACHSMEKYKNFIR